MSFEKKIVVVGIANFAMAFGLKSAWNVLAPKFSLPALTLTDALMMSSIMGIIWTPYIVFHMLFKSNEHVVSHRHLDDHWPHVGG